MLVTNNKKSNEKKEGITSFGKHNGIALIPLIIIIVVTVVVVGVIVAIAIQKGSSRTAESNDVPETREELEGHTNIKESGEQEKSGNNETSYIGCYADVDGNGTADGIIYADLAVGGSGRWDKYDWSDFSYEKSEKKLKEYIVTGEDSSFGGVKRDVIKAVPGSEGEDRFYVMALEDVDGNEHYWYKSAGNKLDDPVRVSDNDFGTGKEKTKEMIEKWNSNGYGEQDDNDLWGLIQQEDIKAKYPLDTWFVPSKAEWAAFGWLLFQPKNKNGFGVSTDDYYSNSILNSMYWSSSQFPPYYAFSAFISQGALSPDRGFCQLLRSPFYNFLKTVRYWRATLCFRLKPNKSKKVDS